MKLSYEANKSMLITAIFMGVWLLIGYVLTIVTSKTWVFLHVINFLLMLYLVMELVNIYMTLYQ